MGSYYVLVVAVEWGVIGHPPADSVATNVADWKACDRSTRLLHAME